MPSCAMTPNTTYAGALPLESAVRSAIINHVIDQRASAAQADFDSNGQWTELCNVYRFGREGADEMSDAQLLAHVAGETVNGVGFVPGPREFERQFGFGVGDVLDGPERLLWLLVKSPATVLRVFDLKTGAWTEKPVGALLALGQQEIKAVLKVGVALKAAN